MPPRKQTSEAPSHFFKKQLTGEEPPSLATMQDLFQLARRFAEMQPWYTLSEGDLIMVPAEDNQICFCSVMGELGEVFALQVYTGLRGYSFFQRLSTGKIHSAGDFFAEHRGVSVEFVHSKELKPPDRELLRALGYSTRGGAPAPMFRANRPGHHPWYITEPEAKLLRKCLQAEIVVLDAISNEPELPLWERNDAYPMVEHAPEENAANRYLIRVEKVPAEVKSRLAPPALDERKLNAVLARRLPVKGVLEVDHFYGSTPIGGPNERKSCMRLAFAADAKSGMVFPPQMESPSAPTGDMLVNAIYAAIETIRGLPASVRVRDPEFKRLLAPLSEALGFRVEVAESLPALEQAKQGLMAFIGG